MEYIHYNYCENKVFINFLCINIFMLYLLFRMEENWNKSYSPELGINYYPKSNML